MIPTPPSTTLLLTVLIDMNVFNSIEQKFWKLAPSLKDFEGRLCAIHQNEMLAGVTMPRLWH